MAEKWVKVKDTGFETPVSEAYFEKYKGDGWFIEIAAPEKPKAPKTSPKVTKVEKES